MCFMADINDNDEVPPSYDVLSARCNDMFEQLMSQDKALEFIMATNKDLESQVDNLTLELANAKTLDDDECSSCHALYSELSKLQSAHDIALHQLENARTELIDVKSALCEKCLESSKLDASGNVKSSFCSFCLEREHEVKDILETVRAKYAKLKDTIESTPCASCAAYKVKVVFLKEKHARAIKAKTCDS